MITLIWLGPATVTQESCLQLRPHFLISNSLSGRTCPNPKSLLGLFEFLTGNQPGLVKGTQVQEPDSSRFSVHHPLVE